jgi:hypothetical protein
MKRLLLVTLLCVVSPPTDNTWLGPWIEQHCMVQEAHIEVYPSYCIGATVIPPQEVPQDCEVAWVPSKIKCDGEKR